MPGNDALGPPPTGEPLAGGFDAWWSAEPIAGDEPPQRLTHWRTPPRDRRRILWLLALVLAGHVLVVVWVMWGTPTRRVVQGHAIEVTFFETAPLPPPPPPPPPWLPAPPLPEAALPPPVRLHHIVPRAPGSITATIETPPRQLDLYGSNGQVRLSSGGPPASAPAYREVMPKGDSVLTINTPLHYKPTRFNKDWAPVNETNGRKLLNKIIDKTTVKKTVKLPTGDRVTCAINPLLALAGGLFGCHGQIPPPPKNDQDIRLSMPPAETLTGKKVTVPASASSASPPPASGG
ncbi:MAG TPA: hypothetical protein VFL63_00305 [Rhodanobacteraceae bacterium]|nr:hypothetical protein [Rhodanobacteraceae bacterium]